MLKKTGAGSGVAEEAGSAGLTVERAQIWFSPAKSSRFPLVPCAQCLQHCHHLAWCSWGLAGSGSAG